MNTKTPNPFLSQLISNISQKANTGRINNLDWKTLSSPNRKSLLEGNMAPKAPDEEEEDVGGEDATAEKDVPPMKGPAPKEPAPKDVPPEEPAGLDSADGEMDSAGEDAEQAQADALKAKAELEKAKAEKDQAEKEIKKHSYVNLVSSAGVHFLLGKLVDSAFKSNTIDSLASEMAGKLKVQTPEDFSNFSEEMAPYRGIPGVSELLSSMKSIATKAPETDSAD